MPDLIEPFRIMTFTLKKLGSATLLDAPANTLLVRLSISLGRTRREIDPGEETPTSSRQLGKLIGAPRFLLITTCTSYIFIN